MPQQSLKAPYGSGIRPMSHLQYFPWKLLLLIIGLFIAVSIYNTKRLPKTAEYDNVAVAVNLMETGIFTDGPASAPGRQSAPGYKYSPGYPALIAFIAGFTPNAIEELKCYVAKRRQCPESRTVNIIILVQIIISALTLLLTFLLALELSKSREIASLTLILLFITMRLGDFSLLLKSNALITSLTITACYFILMGFKRDKASLSLLAGLSFGLVAFFHPPVALTVLFIAPFLYFITHKQSGRGAIHAASLIAGTALVLLPWMARNYGLFGDFALTEQRSTSLLAVRVAYNYMSWTEWFAAFLVWIPGLGDGLAGLIFAPEVIDRLSYSHQGSIIIKDGGNILQKSLLNAKPSSAYWHIVQTYIVGQPGAFLIAIPPVFLHSFWGSGSLIGIIGIFALVRLFKRLKATGTLAGFGLIFWSLTAGILLQSLLSANYHYLNDQILFLHAYAIAHVTGGLELPRIFRRG